MSQSENPLAQQLARQLQADQILRRRQEQELRQREEGFLQEPPPDVELPGDGGPEARARPALTSSGHAQRTRRLRARGQPVKGAGSRGRRWERREE